MEYKNRYELQASIIKMKYIGMGSQATCYLDEEKQIVYKIFHPYLEDIFPNQYSTYDIMKFSEIKNNTFIWPNDVILVNNKIEGYILPYKNAKNLCYIDPLTIDLNEFEMGIYKALGDIKLLTEKNIAINDIVYNIMYSNANFYVIDTIEYENRKVSYNHNVEGFDYELKHFLTDGYFDDFIKVNRMLLEQYKDSKASALMFLKELKKQLSEYLDEPIIMLGDAKKLVKKNVNHLYFRDIK